MAFRLSSPAFQEGQPIPRAHTCDGEDRSPVLSWTDAPAGTKSFALLCDDPDAPRGTWVHWLIHDVPGSLTGLPGGIAGDVQLATPAGARQGKNDFGRHGYGGPCPPPGAPHHYFFRLYALDQLLGLPGGYGRRQLEEAMEGHVLGEAKLMGVYQRTGK